MTKSARRNSVLQLDKLDSERFRYFGIGVGIMGDELHVERLGHAEHLGADIADAEPSPGSGPQGPPPYDRLVAPSPAARRVPADP